MLKIRLARKGKKKMPMYRLVVSEGTRDMYAKANEIVGHYNPHTKTLEVKEERIKYWLGVGAQPSDTVHNLLVEKGLIKESKKTSTSITRKRAEKIKAAKPESEVVA